MYNKIKAYLIKNGQDVTIDKFELHDNSDGRGPFISKWDYQIAQPTQQDLDNITLSEENTAIRNDKNKSFKSNQMWPVIKRLIDHLKIDESIVLDQ